MLTKKGKIAASKPNNLSIPSRLFICVTVVLLTNYDRGLELIGHVRYSKIATWLSEHASLCCVVFLESKPLFKIEREKLKYTFDPKASEPC